MGRFWTHVGDGSDATPPRALSGSMSREVPPPGGGCCADNAYPAVVTKTIRATRTTPACNHRNVSRICPRTMVCSLSRLLSIKPGILGVRSARARRFEKLHYGSAAKQVTE